MFLLATQIQKRSGTFELNEMGGLGTKTPMLACFFIAASLATIGLPGFGNFWGEFGVFLSLGQNPDHHLFLGLAALGIIVSAIFGLRAVAKIFYGPSSEELLEHVKKNPISDLKLYEIVPAGIILLALLFLGFWPRGVSDRIDKEIETRYSSVSKTTSSSLPPCCLLKQNNAKIDGNLTIPSPEKIGVPTQNNFTK
jgi:NADH-quinone oxidoreductase subunit M